MVNLSDYDDYTFKECSYDKENRIYLVDSEEKCIGFDAFAKDFAKSEGFSVSCSVDSLMLKPNKVYFIEFKNSNCRGLKKELTQKLYDSIILLGNVGKDIASIRESGEYVIVFSKEKSPDYSGNYNARNEMEDLLSSRSKNKIIRFVPSELRGFLVKEIKEIVNEDFESFIKIDNYLLLLGV